MKNRPEYKFWVGKRVIVTGHTGFKGGWLSLWLSRMGAHVTGISIPPYTQPSLYKLTRLEKFCDSRFCDIRDYHAISKIVRDVRPEIVFHLAAQPLVREGYRSPIDTYFCNVMGTAHVLDSLRDLDSVRVSVIITTDKVYRNNEWPWPYRENDALGGHDPYSASKAACEIVIESYRKAYLANQGVSVASARAGNVIGGGDWSEDRIIPDAIRAWQNGDILEIRQPESIRPWQYVLEPLAGYLLLAQRLWGDIKLADAYNFGPSADDTIKVRTLIELAQKAYMGGEVKYSKEPNGLHEAANLALDVSKSRQQLDYIPLLPLKEGIIRTIQWYLAQHDGSDARDLCERDITHYEAML